jgi:phosphodiesterase/alkaline phosphatase D-like protein
MRRLIAIAGIGLVLWAGARAQPGSKAIAVPQPQAQTSHFRITRGPMLEYISSHHAVVGWTTSASSTSLLRYGTSKTNLTQTQRSGWPIARKNHRVELSKLKPRTTYYFQVTSSEKAGGSVTSDIGSFTTTAKGDRPVRFPDGP